MLSLFYLQVLERVMRYSLLACVYVICFGVVLFGHVGGYSDNGRSSFLALVLPTFWTQILHLLVRNSYL